MDGILAIPRLFKYAKAEIAITILEKKTLKWTSPELFNDPFEFKSPLEYAFEWDEMMEVALQRFVAILTQIEDPILATGHAAAPTITQLREQWKGRDPSEVSRQFGAGFKELVQTFKDQAASDAKTWFEMKQTYRLLCLSAVHDHILMWSHYAENHRGVVLEFRPIIELHTATLFARPVVYSTEVPVAASLQEYVGWLTGERLKPDASDGFVKSVYTKSSVWAYENEWRVLDKRPSDKEPFLYRAFHPQELVAVYLGCRISPEYRKRMIGIVGSWESRVSLFQMRDERIRFELTAEPISNYKDA
jgi:hypothetical protein